ncbi:recombination mediator RecR [Dubosiella newyorkensis]|jgi:recombination protein RecR|uniref:Recombination protein RecR n=1 Tax=Dubosiella newyorkensis TaxID=1862672 RepID=A0A1U7NPQ5_9FIRM|nr:recombination mediator RecR [Dubosiella newyorkensis]MCI9040243.1 recombination protein RecR [Dubosiella newyorkensis]OLU47590.1 recombination protein RecR [Dubosiella newyorkensis]
MYPREIEDLIFEMQKLPGVGLKTAERFAFTILNLSKEDRDHFSKTIKDLDHIKHCKVCGNLTDHEICSICENQNRDHNMICVVSQPKDILTLENMNSYEGVYHVLNGLINTSKGILPDQLDIENLLKRITPETEEVILALDPTVEGETTALYLQKLLENHVKVSKLASGIPMGAHLDYTDSKTLSRAFEGRK